MVTVNWLGELAFEADPSSGYKVVFDASSEPLTRKGPTPLEALLASAAACSAVDVVVILEKKRQKVSSYRVEIDGVRATEGEYPRPFTSLTVRHILSGDSLSAEAVERAVQLSDEKYCTVLATLRAAPTIVSEWRIE